jgi:hypothetical protein
MGYRVKNGQNNRSVQLTKAIAAHKTPTEIIGELVREKIAISGKERVLQ